MNRDDLYCIRDVVQLARTGRLGVIFYKDRPCKPPNGQAAEHDHQSNQYRPAFQRLPHGSPAQAGTRPPPDSLGQPGARAVRVSCQLHKHGLTIVIEGNEHLKVIATPPVEL